MNDTWVLSCRAEGCQWKVRALELKNLKLWEIRMIERPHTCAMSTISQDYNKMDSKLIGKNILAMVEENEQLTIPTFITFIRQEFGYTHHYISKSMAGKTMSPREGT